MDDIIEQAVNTTREICAKAAEGYTCSGGEGDPIAKAYQDGVNKAAREIANIIRNIVVVMKVSFYDGEDYHS